MRQTPATVVLAAAIAIVYVLMLGAEPGTWTARLLVNWGGNAGRLTLGGEPWRLVTALFLHGSLTHLGGNLICLLAWGGAVESAIGSARFLIAYFACGVLANLAGAALNPTTVSVGASGAIAGTLGVLVVMWLKGDARVDAKGLAINIALNTAVSFLPAVDWVAHLAGFLVGLAIGPFLFRDAMVQRPPPRPAALPFDQAWPMRRPAIAVSFAEPMLFPRGTSVYRTASRLVAVLADATLIADDGKGGATFDSARAYRDATGDEDEWTLVREF